MNYKVPFLKRLFLIFFVTAAIWGGFLTVYSIIAEGDFVFVILGILAMLIGWFGVLYTAYAIKK